MMLRLATVNNFFRQRNNFVFALLFVCTLPFKNSFSNIVALLFAFYSIGTIIVERKLNYSLNLRKLEITKFLVFLFLIYLTSIVYSQNVAEGFRFLGKIFPILICPFLFAGLWLERNDKRLIYIGFLCSNLAAIIFNLARAFYRSISFDDGRPTFDFSVAGGLDFWYSIDQGGNYFFSDEFSTFLHPTYWSIQLLLSFFVVVTYIPITKNPVRILVNSSLLLILFGAIFLCSARIEILSLWIILVLYFINRIGRVKMKYVAVFAVLLLIATVFLATNPRFEVFQTMAKAQTYNSMRLYSWKAGYEVFKSSPFFGVGIGDSEALLMKKYEELNYQENLLYQINEHCQFLQVASATGIVGLILFSGIFLYPFKKRKVREDFLAQAFLISVFLVCLVENYLVRQAGVTFFAVFYCLFFTDNIVLKPLKP